MADTTSQGAGPSVSTRLPSQPRTRSRACLHCRRRKMRCNGAKPWCDQCERATRASECEYDDGVTISETRQLYDKLDRLERRLRELQASQGSSKSRVVGSRQSSSSRSSTGSKPVDVPSLPQQLVDGLYDISTLQSSPHFLSDVPNMQSSSLEMETLLLEFSQTVGSDLDASNLLPWSISDGPPMELSQHLVNAFLPHAEQCGLSLHPGRFAASMSSMHHGPHPALRNVVWLWGCHFSPDRNMDVYKPALLCRAVDGLQDLLQHQSRIIEATQATTLLATYFYGQGRMVEGAYHTNTSALLAMSAGLHRLVPPTPHAGSSAGLNIGSLDLEPVRDGIEWAERLLTFWNVFVLERSWSVASGFMSRRWDGLDSRTKIISPWPHDIRMYQEEIQPPELTFPQPVASNVFDFLQGRDVSVTNSRAELRVKSAALFECAARISEIRDPSVPITQNYRQRFISLQSTAYAFCISLPPLLPHMQRAASSFADCTLFTIHAMTHASIIRMHYALSAENMASHAKCVAAAQAVATSIAYLGPEDFKFLEPIIGSCWTLAALVAFRHLERLSTMSANADHANASAALDAIVTGLNRLGVIYPIAASQASKIDALRWGSG